MFIKFLIWMLIISITIITVILVAAIKDTNITKYETAYVIFKGSLLVELISSTLLIGYSIVGIAMYLFRNL